jgi:glutamate dehydrogenase/leucine dehydrogenase
MEAMADPIAIRLALGDYDEPVYPVFVSQEKIDDNAIELVSYDRLPTDLYADPAEALWLSPTERLKVRRLTITNENIEEFFCAPHGGPLTKDTAFTDLDNPFAFLIHSLVNEGIVRYEGNEDEYINNPERVLDDIRRFTEGGGVRITVANIGMSGAGFASGSAVSSALAVSGFNMAGLQEHASLPTALILALMNEAALGRGTGWQDTYGVLAGYKSLWTKPSKGIPTVHVDQVPVDIEELNKLQIVVFAGRQSHAAGSLISGEQTYGRHDSFLSHHPQRFTVGIMESFAVHYEIVSAFQEKRWADFGRWMNRYVQLRETITPSGATNHIMEYMFRELERSGVSDGGEMVGAMRGGGHCIFCLTDEGREEVTVAGRRITRFQQELEKLREWQDPLYTALTELEKLDGEEVVDMAVVAGSLDVLRLLMSTSIAPDIIFDFDGDAQDLEGLRAALLWLKNAVHPEDVSDEEFRHPIEGNRIVHVAYDDVGVHGGIVEKSEHPSGLPRYLVETLGFKRLREALLDPDIQDPRVAIAEVPDFAQEEFTALADLKAAGEVDRERAQQLEDALRRAYTDGEIEIELFNGGESFAFLSMQAVGAKATDEQGIEPQDAETLTPMEHTMDGLSAAIHALTEPWTGHLVTRDDVNAIFGAHPEIAGDFRSLLTAILEGTDRGTHVEKIRTDMEALGSGEADKLEVVLEIYQAVKGASIDSIVYKEGDDIVLQVDGQRLARLQKGGPAFDEKRRGVMRMTLDRIAKLLLRGSKQDIDDFFEDFDKDVFLNDIYFVYDPVYKQLSISPLYHHPALTYSVGLGGIRHSTDSLGHREDGKQPAIVEVGDLSVSMQWKHAVAGLLYDGVKTLIIAITEDVNLDKEAKKEMLRRLARALVDMGFFELAVDGPDMGVGEEYVEIIVEAAQKRYIENLKAELLLMDRKGAIAITDEPAEYEERLMSMRGRHRLIEGPQMSAMRRLIAESIKNQDNQVVIGHDTVEFGPELEGACMMILGSIVAGGVFHFSDYSPTGFGGAQAAFPIFVDYLRKKGRIIPQDKPDSDVTFRIEGAGDVGGALAYFLTLLGYKVTCISDMHKDAAGNEIYGVVYKESGFTLEEMRTFYRIPIEERDVYEHLGSLPGVVRSRDQHDLRLYPADVEIPAAAAYTLTNYLDVEAALIEAEKAEPVAGKPERKPLEESVGGVAEESNIGFAGAEERLHRRGVPASPGFPINSGGIGWCWLEDYLMHRHLRAELVSGEKADMVNQAVDNAYRDMDFNIRTVLSVVLALTERNKNLNPTQAAELLALAITNRKAQIYIEYMESKRPGAAADAGWAGHISRIDAAASAMKRTGSHMVDEKARAVFMAKIAWEDVMNRFMDELEPEMEALGMERPVKSEELTLLNQWRADIPGAALVSVKATDEQGIEPTMTSEALKIWTALPPNATETQEENAAAKIEMIYQYGSYRGKGIFFDIPDDGILTEKDARRLKKRVEEYFSALETDPAQDVLNFIYEDEIVKVDIGGGLFVTFIRNPGRYRYVQEHMPESGTRRQQLHHYEPDIDLPHAPNEFVEVCQICEVQTSHVVARLTFRGNDYQLIANRNPHGPHSMLLLRVDPEPQHLNGTFVTLFAGCIKALGDEYEGFWNDPFASASLYHEHSQIAKRPLTTMLHNDHDRLGLNSLATVGGTTVSEVLNWPATSYLYQSGSPDGLGRVFGSVVDTLYAEGRTIHDRGVSPNINVSISGGILSVVHFTRRAGYDRPEIALSLDPQYKDAWGRLSGVELGGWLITLRPDAMDYVKELMSVLNDASRAEFGRHLRNFLSLTCIKHDDITPLVRKGLRKATDEQGVEPDETGKEGLPASLEELLEKCPSLKPLSHNALALTLEVAGKGFLDPASIQRFIPVIAEFIPILNELFRAMREALGEGRLSLLGTELYILVARYESAREAVKRLRERYWDRATKDDHVVSKILEPHCEAHNLVTFAMLAKVEADVKAYIAKHGGYHRDAPEAEIKRYAIKGLQGKTGKAKELLGQAVEQIQKGDFSRAQGTLGSASAMHKAALKKVPEIAAAIDEHFKKVGEVTLAQIDEAEERLRQAIVQSMVESLSREEFDVVLTIGRGDDAYEQYTALTKAHPDLNLPEKQDELRKLVKYAGGPDAFESAWNEKAKEAAAVVQRMIAELSREEFDVIIAIARDESPYEEYKALREKHGDLELPERFDDLQPTLKYAGGADALEAAWKTAKATDEQGIEPLTLDAVDVGEFSDIVVFMDKDKTVTLVNEPITEEMLDVIVGLIEKGVHVVIITGGMLEHSVEYVIEPIEERIRQLGRPELWKYFRYYCMSGSEQITWGEDGARKDKYTTEPFSKKDQLEILRALAIAFLEELPDGIYHSDISRHIKWLRECTAIDGVMRVFNGYMATNRGTIGTTTLENAAERLLLLELKKSVELQAAQELQDAELTGRMKARVDKLLEGKLRGEPPIIHFGATFITVNRRDKEPTLMEYREEMGFDNPLEVGIGDSATDYGFLSALLGRGAKIAYLVGEPGKEGLALPTNVVVWPEKSPNGTLQILTQLDTLVGNATDEQGIEPSGPLFDREFHRELLTAVEEAQGCFEEMLKQREHFRMPLNRLQVDVYDDADVDSFRRHLQTIYLLISLNRWHEAYKLVADVDLRVKVLVPSWLKDRDRYALFRNFAKSIESIHDKMVALIVALHKSGIDPTLLGLPDISYFEGRDPKATDEQGIEPVWITDEHAIRGLRDICDRAFVAIAAVGGDPALLDLDHINFEMRSKEDAQRLIEELQSRYGATVASVVEHHERSITALRLAEPLEVIMYDERALSIYSIEISDPKPDKPQPEATTIEHIAFTYLGEFDQVMDRINAVFDSTGSFKAETPCGSFEVRKKPFVVGDSKGFKPVFEDTLMIEIRNDRLAAEKATDEQGIEPEAGGAEVSEVKKKQFGGLKITFDDGDVIEAKNPEDLAEKLDAKFAPEGIRSWPNSPSVLLGLELREMLNSGMFSFNDFSTKIKDDMNRILRRLRELIASRKATDEQGVEPAAKLDIDSIKLEDVKIDELDAVVRITLPGAEPVTITSQTKAFDIATRLMERLERPGFSANATGGNILTMVRKREPDQRDIEASVKLTPFVVADVADEFRTAFAKLLSPAWEDTYTDQDSGITVTRVFEKADQTEESLRSINIDLGNLGIFQGSDEGGVWKDICASLEKSLGELKSHIAKFSSEYIETSGTLNLLYDKNVVKALWPDTTAEDIAKAFAKILDRAASDKATDEQGIEPAGRNGYINMYLDDVRAQGDQVLEALPGAIVVPEGETSMHFVWAGLHDWSSGAWETAERELNHNSGERRAYSIKRINLPELVFDDAPENLANSILRRLNGYKKGFTVLHLPHAMINKLGKAGIDIFTEKGVTIVASSDVVNKDIAVFADILIALGEVKRIIEVEGNLDKYRSLYSILFSIATGPENYKKFNESDLDLILTDPYGFLMKVVVEFPPIKAVLDKWLFDVQHQMIMNAVMELAV